jgi:hypothetical protein
MIDDTFGSLNIFSITMRKMTIAPLGKDFACLLFCAGNQIGIIIQMC